jgi:hypothetical protein
MSSDLPGVNPATLNGMLLYYRLMTKWSGLGDSTELSRVGLSQLHPKSCTLIYTGRGFNALHPSRYTNPTFPQSYNPSSRRRSGVGERVKPVAWSSDERAVGLEVGGVYCKITILYTPCIDTLYMPLEAPHESCPT